MYMDQPWRNQALCREVDPDAFFPERGQSARAAKRVCQDCEVRTPCLDYALEANERHGIYAGLSVRERDRLRHRRLAPVVHLPTPTVPSRDNRRAA